MDAEALRPMRGGAGSAGTTSGVLRVRRREELYREILVRFFVLMKTAQTISTEDEEFGEALERFLEPLSMCLDSEGTLVIGERDGSLYLNAIRARVDARGFPAQKYLVQTLVASEFAGIMFERGVSAKEVCTFLDVFFRPGRPTSAQAFSGLVDAQSICHIHPILRSQLDPDFEADEDEASESLGTSDAGPFFSRKTYFKSIFVLKHLLESLRAVDYFDLRESKQIVQSLVEHLVEDEAADAALDLIRERDVVVFRHSVHSAVLAVGIGRRMGLGRRLLGDLGIAALFQHIAKHEHELASDTTNRAIHMASFRRLITNGGVSRMMLRAALTAYERADSPGDGDVVSLLTRIIRVAGGYHLLVGAKEDGGRALDAKTGITVLRQEPWLQGDAGIVAVLEAIVLHELAACASGA